MNSQQRAAMIRPRGKSVFPQVVAAYKAMQMALDALESVTPACELFHHIKKDQHLEEEICKPYVRYKEAITALRKALNTRSSSTHSDAEYSEVAQPQGEPVAWGYFDADGIFMDALDHQHGAYQTPLHKEVPKLNQILHDTENQPSQYGTVPMDYVEAAIEATKEKAAHLVERFISGDGYAEPFISDIAEAIRSMK